MTVLGRNSNQIMQQPMVQSTSGWAAFDRKHRPQNQKMDASSSDPFPLLSGNAHTGPTSSLTKTNPSNMKSFSSIVRPCNLQEDPVKLLKDANPWADKSLIEDVLQGVNNDMDMASQILKSMVSNNLEAGETSIFDGKCDFNGQKNKALMEEATIDQNNINSNGSDNGLTFSVPVEPEWEECDDVYFNYRKDALKMMRAASNHSRAASSAFWRGDHLSAGQLSQRAREEWAEAEKLNAKAAEEILQLRNANSDLWKLDLHGLHALESVHALQEHLFKIESVDRLKMGPACKNGAGPRPRQSILEVITGIGSHSRGQASLPAAVKGFLIENRYRFEETRPGVIAVHPKFRNTI